MHTENTKEFRHEVYKAALVIYEQEHKAFCIGICYAIYEAIKILYRTNKISYKLHDKYVEYYSKYSNYNEFIEFYSFKPKYLYKYDYWFSLHNSQKRIDILNKCIELTK